MAMQADIVVIGASAGGVGALQLLGDFLRIFRRRFSWCCIFPRGVPANCRKSSPVADSCRRAIRRMAVRPERPYICGAA